MELFKEGNQFFTASNYKGIMDSMRMGDERSEERRVGKEC